MSTKRRWRDLTPTQQRILLSAGVVEAAGKVLALLDLRRRPASQLRGPKWLWAAVVLVVNSGGPAAYFTFARRPSP